MISKGLLGKDISFNNCTWGAGIAFQITKPNLLFKEVLTVIIQL